jgi:hypothetical protein
MGMLKIVEQMGKIDPRCIWKIKLKKKAIHDTKLKAIWTSTCIMTQCGCKSNMMQTSWTTFSHPPHVATPN